MSLLSTNLSSFHVPVPNPSSLNIQRNDHDNLIPDNAGNDSTAESETAEFVLKYWQEHDGADLNDINEFNQRHSEIFPVPDKLIPGSLGDGEVVQEDGTMA
ncbi:hypothetical protein MMC31_005250 [Peltigera leucophlebia]|nr:hypothetical protein [Peltigera leucophlebia]